MGIRMMATFPEHDTTTYYLSKWGEISANAARDHGIEVIELKGEKATRKNLESYLSKFPFCMVFLNGHGDQDTVTGHKNEPLVISGVNESILKSTVTYAISCSTASRLGDSSIRAGAHCYVGYTNDFIFLMDENSYTRPLQDKVAALFLAHTSVFMNTLFKGNTVAEAFEKAKKSLWENITVAESTGNTDLLSWLLWDYNSFVAKGDTAHKL
jgi:hypothetical protein